MAAIESLLNSLVAKSKTGELHNLKWAATGVVDENGKTMQEHVSNSTDAKHVTAAEKTLLGKLNQADGLLQLTDENKIPAEYLAGLGSMSTDYEAADIAGRDTLPTVDLKSGNTCFVLDATADSTVGEGWAIYRWTGTAWMKIMEQESMDVTVSNSWEDISGKPASTPAAIDAAVDKAELLLSDIVTSIPETWPADVRPDGLLFLVDA